MTRWWLTDPAPDAAGTVYLLPHAGGGASAFHSWHADTSRLHLAKVQYPGRENRYREPLIGDIAGLAERIAREIAACGREPTVLLGHSMGGYVAFEVTRRLTGWAMPPRALFVSACLPPHQCRDRRRTGHLSDAELVGSIVELGRARAEQVDPEIWKLALPALRSDLAAVDGYLDSFTLFTEDRLDCHVVALNGTDDHETSSERMSGWRDVSCGTFTQASFPGGHFYLFDHPVQVLGLVGQCLAGDAATRED
jgi:pyochelin biosynthetic protein PchC